MLHARDVTDADDFRLTTAAPAPRWSRDAVVYQIFPDRFARSGGGNGRRRPRGRSGRLGRPGHRRRARTRPCRCTAATWTASPTDLDHIASLGVDTVYLTPFFPAESNHRYDASSFAQVDPLLGGDEALAAPGPAVHARGMRLIGDLTTNHCGDTHEWFRAAQADPASPEREFFFFDGDGRATPPGSATRALPKFRHTSAELRRRLSTGRTRWPPAGCARRTTSTAGASTWPT